MKTLSRLLPLIVVALAATFTLGASKEKKVSWKITGQLEEACSCAAACPCWFDSKPTRRPVVAIRFSSFKRENYGNVKLDGLAVANYAQSPENQTMMDSFGKWNFSTNYIDEKANPEQRKALEAIALTVLPSKNGSPNFETKYVPITRKIEGKDHIITIGNVATFTGRLVEGGLGGNSKITNPPGADPLHHEYAQGKTSKMTYTDSGQNWIGRSPITCWALSLSITRNTKNTPLVSPRRWQRKSRPTRRKIILVAG